MQLLAGGVMIIDIEGTDGSGKATQTKLLFEHLKNFGKCLLLSFPNYDSPSSQVVKMYLNGDLGNNSSFSGYQASAIFAVDRLATIKQTDLTQFDFVILDRYTPSNMIHQSTRINNVEELNQFLNWVQDFEYVKLGLPKPDKILFLDMPVEISAALAHSRTALKNQQQADILEADTAHLTTAYQRAKFVAQKFGWLRIDCADGNKPKTITEIHNLILKALDL